MSGKPLEKILGGILMCGNNCFGGNWWWIIILILLLCNCGCGNSFGNNSNWNNDRCGCDNNCGCC